MRKELWIICAVVLFCAGQSFAALPDIEPRLQQFLAPYGDKVGVYFIDTKSSFEVGVNSDKRYPTASVGKVPVMVTAFHQAEMGRLMLEARLRLKKEDKLEIHEVVSPDFLDVHEEDLSFQNKVIVDGEAYLAHDELILHLAAEAEALIACAICNERVPTKVHLEAFYHAEPLKQIKGAVFDYQELLRESILLETPEF
ncbi:MAG: serine hydrolase, partial [Candidatus Margulisiibacteriota bacterium]